jgi:hypothetical protein
MTPAAVTSMPLRDYQDEAIRALGQLYARGQRRLLVGLPTGTGKTVVFGTLAAKAHAKSAWRVLVLAHRDELIEQAVAKILMIRPDLAMHVGVVKAQRNEWDKDIVVASVQSLHRRRLEQIPRDQFDLVVTDEAHHSAADTYVAILRHFGAAPCLACEKCGGAGERSAAIGTVGTETCDCGGPAGSSASRRPSTRRSASACPRRCSAPTSGTSATSGRTSRTTARSWR